MIKLSGITGKIAQNGGKIGALVGVVAGTTSGLQDVGSIIDEMLKGNIHLPNWPQIGTVFKPSAEQAALTYLVGAFAESLGIHPVATKIGKAVKDGAMSYGMVSFALHVLYYSTHASEGSNPVKGQQAFMNQAPAASNYDYYGK